MQQQRYSNFELLRIVAILFVLLLHANFFALEGPHTQDIASQPLDSTLRILFQTISIVCVDVFVMISGWFGIHPSKKSFCNLMFQIAFYLILIYVLAIAMGYATLSVKGFQDLFLTTPSNWFLKAYICLYIFSPTLNLFVQQASRKEFRVLLLSFFIFQTIYGWIFPKSTDYIQGGYSPISFMGLYLLARYIRIHKSKWSTNTIRNDIMLYIGITVCVIVVCITPPMLKITQDTIYGYNFLTYISPTTILMALLMILITSKLHLHSRFVNWVASSSFAVYMVYVNPNILTSYKDFFHNLHAQYQGIEYWGIVIPMIVVLYVIICMIDYVRKTAWNYFQSILKI